jgi:CheY-like chemotaxis protein
MGGQIGVESEEGQGSRFWFTLDLRLGRGALVVAEEPPFPLSKPRPGRVPHVLVAEDNVTNQKVAVLTLEKLGFRATAVANGQEAIDALRELPCDLVLMDCQMPEMDGYQATLAIRKSRTLPNPNLPIIAMTANAAPQDRERCLAVGMNDYLAKPVRAADLLAMIDRWLPATLPERARLREAGSPPPSAPVAESPKKPLIDLSMVAELRAL